MAIQLTEQELKEQQDGSLIGQLQNVATNLKQAIEQGAGSTWSEERRNAVNSFVIDFAGSIIVQSNGK